MIYFDNASTTRIDIKVQDIMIDVIKNYYGNSSSKYYSQATKASKIIEEARINTARYIGANKNEIIFNGGASEGNNHVIKGIAFETKGHIVTSKTEHSSSIKACEQLEELGYEITYLDVNDYGQININELKKSIKKNTRLVSLIWVNNEIGSINNINRISDFAKSINKGKSDKKKIYFHIDATQGIGKINLNLNKLNIDFLTFSAHKIYGPKGVGLLYVKADEFGSLPYFKSLISGSQEGGHRGGTYAIHNIAGLHKAIELLEENKSYSKKLWKLEDYLIEKLSKFNLIYNGYKRDEKVPGIINIQIPNINNEVFIKENSEELALSTGSACSTTKPSHVLRAIGLDKFRIRNSIRISFGKFNTLEEIDKFLEILEKYM